MKQKILVIDDEAKVALAVKIRLEAAGYQVCTAGDGVQGLRVAREEKPDLVITDISMPEGGGFSVAYRLRESNPQLPVIFITASKQQGLREDAQKLGAVDFVEKPYESADLLNAVAKALNAAPSQPAVPSHTQRSHPKLPEQESVKREPSGGGKKILIIEDDRKIAMALAVRLKSAGYEVSTANDGVQGLRAVLEAKPDLVITDISMPEGGGFSVAYRLRESNPELPVIFITASKQPELKENARQLGAAAYFEKPYNAEELLTVIRSTLAVKNERPPP